MTKSNKSKAIEVKVAFVSDDYTQALVGLWGNCLDLYTYSSNKMSELYRLGGIVRMFAYAKSRLDQIRTDLDEAVKNRDIYKINQIKYKVDYMQEEKAYDRAWSEIERQYDALINEFVEESTNPALIAQFKTADEILKECAKKSAESKEAEFDQTVKALMAEINF